MWSQCLPPSFGQIWLTTREQMRFEGGHLSYRTRTILAILNLYVAPMPPIEFKLNLHYGSKEMSIEKFQDGHHGSHLGCGNGTNLAVLNLHVSPMPPIKFQLNQTYFSRADVVSKFSSWPPWWPSWTLERNKFSSSKSLCHSNAQLSTFSRTVPSNK